MIKGYQEGYDLTLLNTVYHRPRKDDKGNWTKGAITIVAKDNVRNEKIQQTIDNPTYQFYMAKDEYTKDYNEFFIPKDHAEMIEVPYNDLEKEIAKRTGNLDFYYDNIKSGNRGLNKKLHMHTKVFNSDANIEDHYRFRFNKYYQNKQIPITKSYFDIEADTINMSGDFPEPGECPVNAVTIIDDNSHTIYTLLLRNKNNPLIEEFEKGLNKSFIDDMNKLIRDTVGGYKAAHRLDIDQYKFKIMFYNEEDEIKLIQDLFNIINQLKPDFVLVWNMAFDVPYLIQRIINLGYDPKDIICHPDFKYKECEYYIDERNKNEYAQRGDFFLVSSYSVYLDQMIQFASRRKGQSAFESFRLDYIGREVAGVHKLDYSDITLDISKLPYKDYKTFVMYNIMDTICQKCIDHKTGDTDFVFSKCLMNGTRYSKCHRQTTYLVNRGNIEFDKMGYIMGNNVNRDNEKPETKFPGAFVADPKNITNYSKMKINDVYTMLFDNLGDYDYKALYPSLLREFNVAPNTQIGKLFIDDQIYANENPRNDDKFSREGKFMEDLQSHVYLEFATRWFHLASYGELFDDIEEYFTSKANSCKDLNIFTDNGVKPIHIINKENGGIKPISVQNTIRPIVFKSAVINDALLEELNNDY